VHVLDYGLMLADLCGPNVVQILDEQNQNRS
jgi:hypothetical protein